MVATIKELRGKLNLEKFEVLSWEEILPGLVQFIKLDNAGAYVALLILLIVVVFGVMNTTLMSTMERIREFGVMKALGTTPIQIVALVFLETFFITLVGVAIGTLFGCLLSWYYSIYPIDFSFLEESIRAFGIDPMMYCMLTFRGLAWSIGTVSISSLVFCIYPAVHASRFRAAEALRHT